MSGATIYLLGYSGHAFSVADAARSAGMQILGYFDRQLQSVDPFKLVYMGNEQDEKALSNANQAAYFFPAVGDNKLRKKMVDWMNERQLNGINIIHASARVSEMVNMDQHIMIGMGANVNACVSIGAGCIINTGAIIEHECSLSNFVHIAPGAVLCGNVSIEENSFIGANSVIKQGIRIGKNCIVGAGSVVLKDVPDHATIWGNPARIR